MLSHHESVYGLRKGKLCTTFSFNVTEFEKALELLSVS